MKKLSKEAEKLKAALLELSTVDDEAFRAILGVGMGAFDEVNDYKAIVDREGVTVKGDRGQIKAHPLLSVIRDARAQFLAAMKMLHLDEDEGQAKKPGRPTSYERFKAGKKGW